MVSFDGVELGAYVTPALTTVRVPHVEIGAAMVRCIADRLSNPEGGARPPLRISLISEIVRRESTGPAAAVNWARVLAAA